MEYCRLPGVREPVSRVGFGGCPLGGHGWGHVDQEDAIAAVRAALDAGVNFFDTADVYGLGRSEELLSEALGDARKTVVVATKFGVRRTAEGLTVRDLSPSYLVKALEASLRRLRLECIPLYYIHWPDHVTPISEVMTALEQCRQAGKIQAIGVSNFDAALFTQAASLTQISAVQVEYSLLERQAAETLAGVAANEVPLVTWGSLAQGMLTGKFSLTSQFDEHDRRSRYVNFQGERFKYALELVERVKRVSQNLGRTPSQVAIRWLLQRHGVGAVLFGAKNPKQVQDNLGALHWQLTDEEQLQLSFASPSSQAA